MLYSSPILSLTGRSVQLFELLRVINIRTRITLTFHVLEHLKVPLNLSPSRTYCRLQLSRTCQTTKAVSDPVTMATSRDLSNADC